MPELQPAAEVVLDISAWTNEQKSLIQAAAVALLFNAGESERPEYLIGSDTARLQFSVSPGVNVSTVLSQTNMEAQVNAIISAAAPDELWHADSGEASVPIGTIVRWHPLMMAPDGWLLTNGAAVSRRVYKFLFDVIATRYGSGDGTTTFNLPSEVNHMIKF